MKAGQVVSGKYRLDVRLGIGGMGEVWKAIHVGTEREFALKFMHPHVATSSTARSRFTREAKVSAKINHPNVIDIFDVGEVEDGILFLAMELLEGVSLADALHASQPLSVMELLTVVLDTSRALAAAHAVGVVHRDLKPGNIFLQTDRATGFASAKILDFGISKMSGEGEHTKTGAVLGSPRYMSPEQTRSAASVDHRSDLWSMGVILFEGLTGTWPHEGDSFSSLVVAICTLPPTSIDKMVPGLPEPLRAIVRDCLKPLDQRLTSASELATRLASVLTDPVFERMPLPRPLHAPSDSIRTVTSVRVRPPLLTTSTGGAVSPESLRATQQTQPVPDSLRVTRPTAQPYEEDATQVRPRPARVSQAEVSFAMGPQAAPNPGALQAPIAVAPPAPQAAPNPAAPDVPPLPVTPVFKAQLKTIPLKDSAAMFSELARAGVFGPPSSAAQPPASAVAGPAPAFAPAQVPLTTPVPQATSYPAPSELPQSLTQSGPGPFSMDASPTAPRPPDPLLGTVSRNNFETRPETLSTPPQMPPHTPLPAPVMHAAPPRSGSNKVLGVAAAILSVMLVGIVVALVAVLRSGPSAASPADTAAPRPAASAPPPASTAPVAAPSPSAVPSTAPVAPESVAPATVAPATAATVPATVTPTAVPDKPRPAGRPGAPAPKGPSKVKQLGSGL